MFSPFFDVMFAFINPEADSEFLSNRTRIRKHCMATGK